MATATATTPQLSEAQQAWLDFLNTPGIYPDGVDAIGEPYENDKGNAEVIFQDGWKKVQFTLINGANGEPESYESKILNPQDVPE